MCIGAIPSHAQKALHDYLDQAFIHSPLIYENSIRQQANLVEARRIEASLTKPVIGADINYMLSPVLAKSGNGYSFKLNPDKNIPDYYGYDLAVTNGGLYSAVLTLDQPILNRNKAKTIAAQYDAQNNLLANQTKLTAHELQKAVTAQYILCLKHIHQLHFLNKLIQITTTQRKVTLQLASSGVFKQSDVKLLDIELMQQQTDRTAEIAEYHASILDLNILCGINDTTTAMLSDTSFVLRNSESDRSLFTIQYQLDSALVSTKKQVFDLSYKPKISLYSSAGLNTVYVPNIPDRFGLEAGIRFSLTISDGKQRQLNAKHAQLMQQTEAAYTKDFSIRNNIRKTRILQQISSIEAQSTALKEQAKTYDDLLAYYKQQLANGQLSVIDYITILRRRTSLQGTLIILQTNTQLLINDYNYWNW
jgi:hypothetical protein